MKLSEISNQRDILKSNLESIKLVSKNFSYVLDEYSDLYTKVNESLILLSNYDLDNLEIPSDLKKDLKYIFSLLNER